MPVVMISERVGYIPGGVNIGVVLGECGSVAMVDTGLNETNAKKALRAIADELGGAVTTIFTTHAHADHFGGNAAVVKRTGARVWAPPIDEAIIRNPILQPSLLFAGADPPPELRGSFLLAAPSPVDHLIDSDTIDFDGVHIDAVRLPGHSPGQVGLLVDGTFFCADVVLPENVLNKYRIPYLYAVGDHLRSLEAALTVTCEHVVPGHGVVGTSIEVAVGANRALVNNVLDTIRAFCQEPRSAEEVFLHVLDRFDAPINDAAAYYLLHPTIHAFLSELAQRGELRTQVIARKLVWHASG